MKKFNALLFAMALVAVVAFASVASATTFLAVDQSGNVEVVKIDPSASNPLTYSGNTTGTPADLMTSLKTSAAQKTVKVFPWEGGFAIISADIAGAETDRVALYEVTDGNVAYSSKNGDLGILTKGITGGASSSGIKKVETLNGNPVFIADNAISTILTKNDHAFVSFDYTSIDTTFTLNSKLYVIHSDDTCHTFIGEISNINSSTAMNTSTRGGAFKKDTEVFTVWNNMAPDYAYSAAVVGSFVYVVDSHDLIKFDASEMSQQGIVLTSKTPTITTTKLENPEYRAMTTDGTTLYALKETNSSYAVVSVTDEAETWLYDVTASDVNATETGSSFDIYYDPTDKVIAVVNQGKKVAFYANINDSWSKLTARETFVTAAPVLTASTTPDTPDTPVTPTPAAQVVDVANSTAAQTAIAAAFPNVPASSFLTSDKATLGTADAISDAAKEALEAKVEDGYHVKSYNLLKKVTLTEKGYILLEGTDIQKLDSSKHVVLAFNASGTSYPVKLLNASGTVLAETVTYLGAGELEAGTYNIYYAEKEKDSDDSGDTGSSSSGCNAGFAAVSALLALAFIKKSR